MATDVEDDAADVVDLADVADVAVVFMCVNPCPECGCRQAGHAQCRCDDGSRAA